MVQNKAHPSTTTIQVLRRSQFISPPFLCSYAARHYTKDGNSLNLNRWLTIVIYQAVRRGRHHPHRPADLHSQRKPQIPRTNDWTDPTPQYGFKKLFQLLRRQGNTWNHKHVHRIYCLLKLNFRHRGKQRLPVRNSVPLATPEALN